MTQLTKSAIYKQLTEIGHTNNIDISHWLSMLVGSTDIPYEVIVFINKYQPISELTTYNAVYNKRNKSRLFRNIVSDSLSIPEQAVVLSSLLTQCLISASKHQTASEQLIDAVNTDLIMRTLTAYITENNEQNIQRVFQMYRTIFKTLFPKTRK